MITLSRAAEIFRRSRGIYFDTHTHTHTAYENPLERHVPATDACFLLLRSRFHFNPVFTTPGAESVNYCWLFGPESEAAPS